MKRFLVVAVPALTIILFVLVMISDNFLKQPLGYDDDVPAYIQAIIQDINDDKWEAAEGKTQQLSNAWRKVVKRIQFSAEKDEINAFDINIARLHGAIMSKDKSNALIELKEALEHWDNVGK